jgi:excisionase family DNA binding protein
VTLHVKDTQIPKLFPPTRVGEVSGNTCPSREATRPPLLTTRQVADWLGVSPETVLRRWRAGELPGYRLASNALRFNAAEVAAWLEQRRTP